MNLGLPEILVILFLVLLLFGGKRLPELARGIGKALSEFRKGVRETADEPDPPAARDASKGDEKAK
jgi:sec-independent protein translocase protein TatA